MVINYGISVAELWISTTELWIYIYISKRDVDGLLTIYMDDCEFVYPYYQQVSGVNMKVCANGISLGGSEAFSSL